MKSDFGLIGLAVMGENLALNIERNGFRVSVFNRSADKVNAFMQGRGKGKKFYGATSAQDLCDSLTSPRRIMLMVKAGEAVDATISSLLPYLEQGDIIIDGGNSNFPDTERRVKDLGEKGILFVGSGVSGGEEGALNGPSIMPGGEKKAWPAIRPVFEAITAKAGVNGEPCTTWIGEGGSGHFVKMVHNGIEYGDMQIICEGYDLAGRIMGLSNPNMAALFEKWNHGRLQSYLIEITAEILKFREGDGYLVDKILDTAGQKGTGKWTSITALDEGIPLNLITESVFARYVSAQKELRGKLASLYRKRSGNCPAKEKMLLFTEEELEGAVYASKLLSYAQGFELITSKSQQKGWNIHTAELAKIWRGGCIIRSSFLDDIAHAYTTHGNIENLLLSEFYQKNLPEAIQSLRKVVAAAALNGIPVPCMSAALSYYDSVTTQRLPANLLQGQRDYFGAHTYERTDAPRGEFFHNLWGE